MKISISLPDDDVVFVDRYAKDHGYASRSAVVHRAVRLLRASLLGDAYADAWQEWADLGEADVWDTATDDGLGSTDAAR